jgi:RND family efflux transporter MFP subunit
VNALLVVCTAALAACGGTSSGPAASETASPEVRVFVVPASSPGSAYTTLTTIMVEHETDLLAEEQGRLMEIVVDQGSRVRKGDRLARLDDSTLRKTVEQNRAESQMLEVQARQAEVLRQAAEVELQRQSELRKEGLGSMRDYDRARFSLESMKHEVEKSRFEFAAAKAKLEENEIRLSRMQIRAPYDGIISRRYAREGQMLLREEKVLRITELQPLLVRFTVPESLRGRAGVGALVEVTPADKSSGPVQARVLRTGFVVDPASGSVECTAQLQNPGSTLLPGMAVEVRLPDTRNAAGSFSAMLPASAVRRLPSGTGEIFIVRGDKLERREVRLGQDSSEGILVLSGLSGGERVVLSAQSSLKDGMAVRVRP